MHERSTTALQAAKAGRLAELHDLGLDTSQQLIDSDHAGLVHYAARSDNIDVLDFVVKKRGFPVEARTTIGATPMHDAAATGCINSVSWLLGETALNGSETDHYGVTPLHLSARYGHLTCARWLLTQSEAQVHAKTKCGATALHMACVRGDLDMAKLLVEHRPRRTAESDESEDEHTSYGCACCRHQNGMVNAQLASGATACYLACQAGHTEVVRYLVAEAGASLKLLAHDGMSCLHAAAQQGNLDLVQYLVTEQHMKPDDKDLDGSTSLHLASARGHLEVVMWLLQRGSRSVLDSLGSSALHEAAQHGHMEVVRCLLNSGFQVGLRDQQGLSAADLAQICEHEAVAAYLRHGRLNDLSTPVIQEGLQNLRKSFEQERLAVSRNIVEQYGTRVRRDSSSSTKSNKKITFGEVEVIENGGSFNQLAEQMKNLILGEAEKRKLQEDMDRSDNEKKEMERDTLREEEREMEEGGESKPEDVTIMIDESAGDEEMLPPPPPLIPVLSLPPLPFLPPPPPPNIDLMETTNGEMHHAISHPAPPNDMSANGHMINGGNQHGISRSCPVMTPSGRENNDSPLIDLSEPVVVIPHQTSQSVPLLQTSFQVDGSAEVSACHNGFAGSDGNGFATVLHPSSDHIPLSPSVSSTSGSHMADSRDQDRPIEQHQAIKESLVFPPPPAIDPPPLPRKPQVFRGGKKLPPLPPPPPPPLPSRNNDIKDDKEEEISSSVAQEAMRKGKDDDDVSQGDESSSNEGQSYDIGAPMEDEVRKVKVLDTLSENQGESSDNMCTMEQEGEETKETRESETAVPEDPIVPLKRHLVAANLDSLMRNLSFRLKRNTHHVIRSKVVAEDTLNAERGDRTLRKNKSLQSINKALDQIQDSVRSRDQSDRRGSKQEEESTSEHETLRQDETGNKTICKRADIKDNLDEKTQEPSPFSTTSDCEVKSSTDPTHITEERVDRSIIRTHDDNHQVSPRCTIPEECRKESSMEINAGNLKETYIDEGADIRTVKEEEIESDHRDSSTERSNDPSSRREEQEASPKPTTTEEPVPSLETNAVEKPPSTPEVALVKKLLVPIESEEPVLNLAPIRVEQPICPTNIAAEAPMAPIKSEETLVSLEAGGVNQPTSHSIQAKTEEVAHTSSIESGKFDMSSASIEVQQPPSTHAPTKEGVTTIVSEIPVLPSSGPTKDAQSMSPNRETHAHVSAPDESKDPALPLLEPIKDVLPTPTMIRTDIEETNPIGSTEGEESDKTEEHDIVDKPMIIHAQNGPIIKHESTNTPVIQDDEISPFSHTHCKASISALPQEYEAGQIDQNNETLLSNNIQEKRGEHLSIEPQGCDPQNDEKTPATHIQGKEEESEHSKMFLVPRTDKIGSDVGITHPEETLNAVSIIEVTHDVIPIIHIAASKVQRTDVTNHSPARDHMTADSIHVHRVHVDIADNNAEGEDEKVGGKESRIEHNSDDGHANDTCFINELESDIHGKQKVTDSPITDVSSNSVNTDANDVMIQAHFKFLSEGGHVVSDATSGGSTPLDSSNEETLTTHL